MAIISIMRDWGMDPSIVRIVSSNTLAEIGATDYLYDQRFVISDINGGTFNYAVSDFVFVYSTSEGKWGIYTITPDFKSLTLIVTTDTTGFANAPVNTNITSMVGLTGKLQAPTAIADSSGNNVLAFSYTGSAVNNFQIRNGIAGSTVGLDTVGTSTNVGAILTAKGAGGWQFRSGTATNPISFVPSSDTNSFAGTFDVPTITAARTYTLQNASGTLAFTSDISAQTDYVNVTGTSQVVAENTKYLANSGSLVTFTIPANFGIGKWFKVVGAGAGGWRVQQAIATHQIKLLAVSSTLGIAGTVDSTDPLDGAEFVCIVANDIFNMQEVVGNPNLL